MLITETDLFKGVSQRAMSEIVAESTEESYSQGTIIFRAGDKAHFFYVLGEGTVDISAGIKGSFHFTIDRPGAVIGWSALVEPFTYTAQAAAISPVKLIKIPREAMQHIMDKYPEDGSRVIRHLATLIGKRLRDAYANITSEAPI